MNENKRKSPIDEERLDRALKAAVQRAIWEHKQLGVPICESRDGQVIWIQPEDIVVEKPTEKR